MDAWIKVGKPHGPKTRIAGGLFVVALARDRAARHGASIELGGGQARDRGAIRGRVRGLRPGGAQNERPRETGGGKTTACAVGTARLEGAGTVPGMRDVRDTVRPTVRHATGARTDCDDLMRRSREAAEEISSISRRPASLPLLEGIFWVG